MFDGHLLRGTRGAGEVANANVRIYFVNPSLWEVFVWGFGVVFWSCLCVSVVGVLFSVVCVCVTY